MPQGPAGAPRLTNIGPLSRQTEEEIREEWLRCPQSGTERDICENIKFVSIDILEDQGVLASCDDLVDINSGECASVARQTYARLEDTDGVSVLAIGDKDHVWIEYRGKHYDAEVPTGVDEFIQLPFFQRIPIDALKDIALQAPHIEVDPPVRAEDILFDITDEIEQES